MSRFLATRALPLAGAAAVVAGALSLTAGLAATSPAAAAPAKNAAHYAVFAPPSRFALSNWGGYIAEGSSGEFTSASADWKIAKSTCNASDDLYAPWVGIDGDGDETVEQTGVATSCSGGKPVEDAWYEMYPASPVYFSTKIKVGDLIEASVVYSGGEFTLTMTDKTAGWTHKVSKKLASAKLLCAEAIIEAPGGGGTFPKFSKVTFTDVEFNGKALSTFNPVASDTGTSKRELVPSAITDGDDFSMVPKA
jgi:hypothetical protein